MIEVTQWFKCDDHKPVHEGWYEAKYDAYYSKTSQKCFRYWSGTGWFLNEELLCPMFSDVDNNDQWRGLTKENECANEGSKKIKIGA